MKTRHLLMLAGLAGSAALVVFDGRSGADDLARPLARRADAAAAGRPAEAPAAASGIGTGPGNRPEDLKAPAGAKGPEDLKRPEVAKGPGGPKGQEGGLAVAGAPSILALRPREELVAIDPGNGRLFTGHSWTPPPARTKPEPPPPPPMAPPLPFTYLGKQATGDGVEVFLARGDRVFVVREQSVIDATYRVESIRAPLLSLTYLPLNQIQQLSIGARD